MPQYRTRRRAVPMVQAIWVVIFAVTGLVGAVIASTPVSTWTQALLGVLGVSAVVMLRPWADRPVQRFALLAIAGSLVLRYWVWRLTETLPGLDTPVSFVCAALLFLTETYAICVFFLTAFITADPRTRPEPPTVAVEDLPTVDVLVPSFNEPVAMLKVTLAAAANMHYPPDKLRVILCDDGGTDERIASDDPWIARAAVARRAELKELCEDLDLIYATRARNENAKAGNMSAALENLSGDLVAVFDADHVPSRDFLARTAGHFVEHDDLFLVQTPHFFLNPDPISRNVGFVDHCPPENEMFYGHIHRGLDRWNGTFFCGSAALLRREALDSVGGFSGQTITEDAETALDIHAAGWRSMYVNRAMVGGLQPESFASLVRQRGRWAAGMMQMLMLKNPVFRRGLSVSQRLCYVNSVTFWFFPAVRMIFLLAPLCYLFLGLEIFVATREEVVAYMATYVAVSFIVQNALFNRSRWPLMSELYETAQAPYLSRAVLRTLVRPRGARFDVTAKDETLEEDALSAIATPLLVVTGLVALGVAAAGVRYYLFPGDREVLQVVGGWALFNLILLGAALPCLRERRQRRGAPRVAMKEPALVALAGHPDRGLPGQIIDASLTGARVLIAAGPDVTPAQISQGTPITVLPTLGDAPELAHPILGTVAWAGRLDRRIVLGVEFSPDQCASASETVAQLIYGKSSRWAATRAHYFQEKGLLGGMFYILRLSVRGFATIAVTLAAEPARRARARAAEIETTVGTEIEVHEKAFQGYAIAGRAEVLSLEHFTAFRAQLNGRDASPLPVSAAARPADDGNASGPGMRYGSPVPMQASPPRPAPERTPEATHVTSILEMPPQNRPRRAAADRKREGAG